MAGGGYISSRPSEAPNYYSSDHGAIYANRPAERTPCESCISLICCHILLFSLPAFASVRPKTGSESQWDPRLRQPAEAQQRQLSSGGSGGLQTPASKYQQWNAVRVNNALETAAQVAAAPIGNSIRIRTASPNPKSEQRGNWTGGLLYAGANGTPPMASQVASSPLRATGSSSRAGSAPPLRQAQVTASADKSFQLRSRAPSPGSGRTPQTHSLSFGPTSSGTSIAIGGGSALGRGAHTANVSPVVHPPISSSGQAYGSWSVQPGNNENGRTSPLRAPSTTSMPQRGANAAHAAMTSRAQSPRIPLRPGGAMVAAQHTGQQPIAVPPPAVMRGRFSNYNNR